MTIEPEGNWGHQSRSDGPDIETDVESNHAVDTLVESSRARREISTHAHSDESDLRWQWMRARVFVQNNCCWLFPFVSERDALVANDRSLSGPLIGEN